MEKPSKKKPLRSAMPTEKQAAANEGARRGARRTSKTPASPETIAHLLPADATDASNLATATTTVDVGATVHSTTVAPIEPRQKRFDVFIADVGWQSPVAQAIRDNVDRCLKYQANSTVYVLSEEQCVRLFKMHPSMIGTEPSIFFIDRDAYAKNRSGGFGFKLNFGLIRDVPTANNLLKWVLAVIAEQKTGSDVTEPIRTVIHKEGLRGAIDILADIAHSPVGETATH